MIGWYRKKPHTFGISVVSRVEESIFSFRDTLIPQKHFRILMLHPHVFTQYIHAEWWPWVRCSGYHGEQNMLGYCCPRTYIWFVANEQIKEIIPDGNKCHANIISRRQCRSGDSSLDKGRLGSLRRAVRERRENILAKEW